MTASKGATRVVNHKILRAGTGIIAIILPLMVQWLSTVKNLSSVSMSYWTDSGDIFVGSLTAIAFFLAAYNGTSEIKKDMEYWVSKCAGLFALLVALIPTHCTLLACGTVPQWVMTITLNNPRFVHNAAAILLFVCLFLLIRVFAKRAKAKGRENRSLIYNSISLGMLIGMPAIAIIGKLTDWQEWIYWLEVVGLMLFGLGWLIAGTYKNISVPAQV
ncbi:MAG: hypothetical protein JXQ90_13580 [Cyclobacteriaceae bacterium]